MNFLKKITQKNKQEEEIIETIEEIIDERQERGDEKIVEPKELFLLKNIFKLKELQADDIMIERVDIVGISLNASLQELKKVVLADKFTRLPVYNKTLDNVVGILHMKDLLCAFFEQKDIVVKDIMTPNVLFVPPSILALDLLHEMQIRRTQIAIVVDEYGGTDGLITLEDLLEVIVGEIEDEHDSGSDAPKIKKINNNTIIADAKALLEDIQKQTGHFLNSTHQDIDTLGGLVFNLAGRLPKRGEIITHPLGIKFQVIDLDNCCIKKVKISGFAEIFAKEHNKESEK